MRNFLFICFIFFSFFSVFGIVLEQAGKNKRDIFLEGAGKTTFFVCLFTIIMLALIRDLGVV